MICQSFTVVDANVVVVQATVLDICLDMSILVRHICEVS